MKLDYFLLIVFLVAVVCGIYVLTQQQNKMPSDRFYCESDSDCIDVEQCYTYVGPPIYQNKYASIQPLNCVGESPLISHPIKYELGYSGKCISNRCQAFQNKTLFCEKLCGYTKPVVDSFLGCLKKYGDYKTCRNQFISSEYLYSLDCAKNYNNTEVCSIKSSPWGSELAGIREFYLLWTEMCTNEIYCPSINENSQIITQYVV